MNLQFKSLRNLIAIPLALALCVAGGCGKPAGSSASHGHDHGHGHDHDHSTMSYSAAVAEVEELHASIRKAFEAGKGEDAHDDLHHIGDLLDAIPKLAGKTKMSADDQTAVKEAADKVFSAYGRIDEAFHPGEGQEVGDVKYADFAEEIDAGVAVLVAKLEASGEEDRDHAGHDHGEHADDGHGHDGDHDHDEGHDEEQGHDDDHDHDE